MPYTSKTESDYRHVCREIDILELRLDDTNDPLEVLRINIILHGLIERKKSIIAYMESLK